MMVMSSTFAGPVPDKETVEVVCDGCNAAELAETVRKARQIYEDISVDIVSGGGTINRHIWNEMDIKMI